MAAGGEITWDMVHYDVQLIGGMVLHDGKVAEMATVKVNPGHYPAGLTSTGCPYQGCTSLPLTTTYLPRPGMVGPSSSSVPDGRLYRQVPPSLQRAPARLQLRHHLRHQQRIGFDYLRDNMVRSTDERQRKYHYAMIDEVDSVFIDDARTPLIISYGAQGSEDQEYIELRPEVEKLIGVQRKLPPITWLKPAACSRKANGYQEGKFGHALLRAYRALPKLKYRPLIKFQ